MRDLFQEHSEVGALLDVRCARALCRVELALDEEQGFAPLESVLLQQQGVQTFVRVSEPPERKASIFMVAEGHELPMPQDRSSS